MITKNKMERPHYNWLKIVLAEKEKTGTGLSEQMGRNVTGTEVTCHVEDKIHDKNKYIRC